MLTEYAESSELEGRSGQNIYRIQMQSCHNFTENLLFLHYLINILAYYNSLSFDIVILCNVIALSCCIENNSYIVLLNL